MTTTPKGGARAVAAAAGAGRLEEGEVRPGSGDGPPSARDDASGGPRGAVFEGDAPPAEGVGPLARPSWRDLGVYLTYRGLGELMAALPRPVSGAAATGVGLGLSRFRRTERALYARHIRRVLGPELTDVEVRVWTRRAFVAYARYWFEGAVLPRLGHDEISARMMMERGFDHLQRAMAGGKGAILALPHVGSWEWGGAWLAQVGYPMTSVAEPVEPEQLYRWFVAQRERMGLTILPIGGDTTGPLLRTLRSGGLVGLVCDRDVMGGGVPVEFFGERTTMPAGPALLALRSGAPLMTAAVYSGPGRDHTGVVNPPIDTTRQGGLRAEVARVTQQVATELEALIRRAPEQWHLFQPNWPSDAGAAGGGVSAS